MRPDSPVTSEHIRVFAAKGFVLIPDLLRDAEIEHYGAAVDRAVSHRTAWDPRSLREKTRYEQSFQQCLNLWEDREDVRPATFHPRIAEAAARLLGVEAVRVWHDQALYKEASGIGTDPHQDQPYWAIREPLTITAWIPFQRVTEDNGALGYIAGSHRSGLRKFANIFTGTGLDLEAHEETREHEIEFVDVPSGSIAFHHGLTVHMARPNRSDSVRRVYTIIYFADGCTRSDRPHPSVDRPGIVVGERIESTLTPIAWPRPEGDLPERPPPPEPPSPGWAGWRPDPERLEKLVERLKKEGVSDLDPK
jgi:ectoine hydroxylase-related dioxygenase (phytanoyl-CoA dioxygenase family)